MGFYLLERNPAPYPETELIILESRLGIEISGEMFT